MMRTPLWHTFRGHQLDLNAVVAVDPVKEHSTGKQACDWELGFRVALVGNETVIRIPMPRGLGYAGSRHTPESYRAEAEQARADFIALLQTPL
jgi:hypothetical protein